MTFADIFGILGASLTTISFVPQAAMVIRTKRTEGISLLMYSLFTIGVAFWLAYGVLLGEWPIILANSITLLLASTILAIAAKTRLNNRGTLKAKGPTP